MNMGGLQAAFAKHRTPILVGGAAAVSGLGLYAHHKNAANPSTPAQTTPAVSGGANVAGTASYDPSVDTTGTDVYNALQPQMAQEQSLLSQLIDALKNQVPKPTTPKPPAKTTPPPRHTGPVKPPTPIKKKPLPKKPPKGPTHKTPTRTTYVVRKGDNLTTIGRRFHTTWQHIYAANRAVIGRNPNYILPGQHLVIP